jgi:hypothetical protein
MCVVHFENPYKYVDKVNISSFIYDVACHYSCRGKPHEDITFLLHQNIYSDV